MAIVWSWFLLLVLVSVACSRHVWKWWQRRRFTVAFQKQGIQGPRGNPLSGGVMLEIFRMRHSRRGRQIQGHDVVDQVLPDHVLYSKLYGVPYFYHWADDPKLIVKDPEIAREILAKKVGYVGRSPASKRAITRFLGRGLVSVDGEEWAHHRRVVSPAFHLEKLKNMVQSFVGCTEKVLDNWEVLVVNSGRSQAEIEMADEFRKLTADIISHTAFGSNFEKGQVVFDSMNLLARLMNKQALLSWIPLHRYLPTSSNWRIWKLQREIDDVLLRIIRERQDLFRRGKAQSYGSDLLGLVLAESEGNTLFGNQAVIGECKTFFLAGHETTASLLTWSVYLLALYPEWQDRARAEVREVFVRGDGSNPSIETLSKLKVMGMILYETLRLYPPASAVIRMCQVDMQFGDLYVPKGTNVEVPISALHHDKELYGPDVNEFNPDRFVNGASKAAKHPNAFMPFSFGPRICVGQSFALLEVKTVLAMLLSRFCFSLSPAYRHSPHVYVTLKPHYGMQVLLQKL